MTVQQRQREESREIASWRRDRLVDAGFSLPLAARLATDGGYDLHALIELTESGCPPDLATRILAPLDDEAVA